MRFVWLSLPILCVACEPADVRSDASAEPGGRARVIDGDPLCPDCAVVLREVAVLGDAADPSSVRENAAGRGCMVGRLGTGEYLMSGAVGGGEIFVYNGTGPAGRTIGSEGGGPGEFGMLVRLVVAPGDTLYVVDDDLARVQVLTPAGEFIRSFPAPGQFRSFALLNDGNLIFHRTPTFQGDVLFRLVSPTGAELARFGTATMEAFDLETWIVSPAQPNGFWTASIWKYELYQWSAPDSLERTLTREVDWFPPDAEYPDGIYESAPPPPYFDYVWQDRAGRVWTYLLVPDPGWEPGLDMRHRIEWYRRTFDTIIEVIDLESARLIAQGRYDGRLGAVCGSHLMYTVVETEDGDTRVQVLEPMLVGADRTLVATGR